MAYDSLQSTIEANIYQNPDGDVTGEVLQNELVRVIQTMGVNLYRGVATPTTDPSETDEPFWYIATEAGTYTHFDSSVVDSGGFAILTFDGLNFDVDNVAFEDLTIDNLTINDYTFPSADGSAEQILKTDGAGTISWASADSTNLVTKTANYTAVASDNAIMADGSSNTVTITLPTAVGISGKEYAIKCIDDTYTVDIATNASEEIDEDSSNFELFKDESITIKSDGANWWII